MYRALRTKSSAGPAKWVVEFTGIIIGSRRLYLTRRSVELATSSSDRRRAAQRRGSRNSPAPANGVTDGALPTCATKNI